MDGYVSKPIQSGELFSVISSLQLNQSTIRGANSSVRSSNQVFDQKKLMSMVDNDESLLLDIVSLFLEDCPTKLNEIRKAIARKDSNVVMNEAHALKGAVGNFAARAAFE